MWKASRAAKTLEMNSSDITVVSVDADVGAAELEQEGGGVGREAGEVVLQAGRALRLDHQPGGHRVEQADRQHRQKVARGTVRFGSLASSL